MITRYFQSINQNLYSAPSRCMYLLGGAPKPGQAEKNSLENMVDLRTGTVWEVPWIHWKPIPGYWTIHRKWTGLYCRRAGEWDHKMSKHSMAYRYFVVAWPLFAWNKIGLINISTKYHRECIKNEQFWISKHRKKQVMTCKARKQGKGELNDLKWIPRQNGGHSTIKYRSWT